MAAGTSDEQVLDQVVQDRWDLVMPHRRALLLIAQRRVVTPEDAEDAVSTAMLRAVEHPGLDAERVGAFLCSTVIRLTADTHRLRARQAALGLRLAGRATSAPPVDERICDEDEARWLARHLAAAPRREREVLHARTAGLTAAQTAEALALSSKATENAYTRLRRRAAAVLATSLVGTGFASALRRLARPAAVTVPALTLATAALLNVPTQQSQQAPQPAIEQPDQAGARLAAAPVPASTAPAVTAVKRAASTEPVPPVAPAVKPVGTRTQVVAPIDSALVQGGGLHVESTREEETFEESLQHCLERTPILLRDPLADPCA